MDSARDQALLRGCEGLCDYADEVRGRSFRRNLRLRCSPWLRIHGVEERRWRCSCGPPAQFARVCVRAFFSDFTKVTSGTIELTQVADTSRRVHCDVGGATSLERNNFRNQDRISTPDSGITYIGSPGSFETLSEFVGIGSDRFPIDEISRHF